MPPASRFALLHPEVSLAFSRSTVRALSRLAPEAFDGVDLACRLAVAEALFTRRFPTGLADLLDEIARFEGEPAREALLEAAADRRFSHDDWLARPAVDVGAKVARGAAKSPALQAIARRAHIRIGRRYAPRAFYEERLVVRARASRPTLFEEAARLVHGEGLVRVFLADTEDGVVRAAIIHRGPAVRVVVDDETKRVRARVIRPLACDVVRWDASRGRVSFVLARPAALVAWKEALVTATGAPLYDERPAFTTKPLHAVGTRWLEAVKRRGGRVREMEAVACELDDGHRFSVRGDKVLDALYRRLGHGGYIYRITLRLRIEGASRPTDVTLELPNKLLISEPRWEEEVRIALDALALTDAGVLKDDLASLAPFVHPAWRWMELLGEDGFFSTAHLGRLIEVQSRRAGELRHRPWGSMFTVFDVEGENAMYAVAEDAAAPAHTVTEEAVVRWRLDQGALAEAFRRELELEPLVVKPAPQGILPLGVLPARGASIAFFLLLAVVPEAQCAALREAVRAACAKGRTPVVLVGEGRTLHGGITEIAVTPLEQVAGPSIRRLIAAAAEATGLSEELDPWRWRTREAPLVLMRRTREAWLGRVKLSISPAQFDGLLLLSGARAVAGKNGQSVRDWTTPSKIGEALSPQAQIPEQIARKTFADLDDRMNVSFAEAGETLPEAWKGGLVEMRRRQGYRLKVGVIVK